MDFFSFVETWQLFLFVRPAAVGWDDNPHAVRWDLASISGGECTVGSTCDYTGNVFLKCKLQL